MLWDSVMPESLDWEVGLQPIYRRNGTTIPGRFETYRVDTDKHLGVVGPGYVPLQNRTCAEFIKMIPGAEIEKAGTFSHGARVWWAVRLPGAMTVGEEKIHKYSVMVNGHDGNYGFRWFITPIRPYCSNMMNLLVSKAVDFSISAKHTQNIEDRIAVAAELFAEVNEVYAEMAEAFTALSNVHFTDIINYIEAVFKIKEPYTARSVALIEQIEHNFYADEIYTRWGALNAVTKYIDHQKPMRGANQDERRFAQSVMGPSATLKQRAYDLIKEGPDGPDYLHYVSECASE